MNRSLLQSAESSGRAAGSGSRTEKSVAENWRRLFWPVLAWLALLLFNEIFSSDFLRVELKNGHFYGSQIDILNRGAPVMLLALGMSFVIGSGGVDLSVGAIMAISGTVAAWMVAPSGNGPLALLAALGVGILAGAWNGVLVASFRIQPIVATLILMVAGRGIAQLLSGGQIITFRNPTVEFLGVGYFLGLPFAVTLVVIVFAILGWLARRTALGLFVEAAGNNLAASRVAGVPVPFVIFLVYVISGFCAGLAGIIVAANIRAADANNAGLWLELDAILAVVIGGTTLAGGRFYLLNSLIGALLIQTLTTTILTRNIPVQFTLVVKAVVVLGVCLLQAEKFRRRARTAWRRLRGGEG